MWRQPLSRVTSALMPLGLSVRLMLDAIAFGSPCLSRSRGVCCGMGGALFLGGWRGWVVVCAVWFGSPCLSSSRGFCCVMGSALFLGWVESRQIILTDRHS